MKSVQAEAIERAIQAGISGFMLAGVDPQDWRAQIAIAKRYPQCLLSYGIHPQRIAQIEDEQCEAMFGELQTAIGGGQWPRPHAIGEIGLDAWTKQRQQSLPRQERLFRKQLALAKQQKLPVILHILGAHGRALEILQQEGISQAGGVVHSYSGSAQLVGAYCSLGLHISFAGGITLPKARKAKEAVLCVPRERLMVETDAPDQTPAEHRPGPNEPAYLPLIIESIARLRQESSDEVAVYTATNARTLFGAQNHHENPPVAAP